MTADPARAHNAVLFRQPVTTLDAHLERGLRVAALGELLEGAALVDEDGSSTAEELQFGPPVLRPTSFRDFYAFEQHVGTMWKRRGHDIPEAWFRLPIFYFSNVSEIRGPGEAVWAPDGSVELDYELEVGALVDTPAVDLPAERAEEAIGGYFVLNDWSARDLQREETTVRLGPAKGKDFATSIGPWLVTPDELADVRSGTGYHAGHDRRHQRNRDQPRDLVGGPASRSGTCSRARRRTCGCAPGTSWAAARWGAAACSRSARSDSGGGSSRATRSSCASSVLVS